MPIKAIHIERPLHHPIWWAKTEPTIWLSRVWALSLWDKDQHGLLPNLFIQGVFKMVVQLEPFGLVQSGHRFDRRLVRFVIGLILKQFKGQIGLELWPVDGWTTGRFLKHWWKVKTTYIGSSNENTHVPYTWVVKK